MFYVQIYFNNFALSPWNLSHVLYCEISNEAAFLLWRKFSRAFSTLYLELCPSFMKKYAALSSNYLRILEEVPLTERICMFQCIQKALNDKYYITPQTRREYLPCLVHCEPKIKNVSWLKLLFSKIEDTFIKLIDHASKVYVIIQINQFDECWLIQKVTFFLVVLPW